jgi:hypothetical protein
VRRKTKRSSESFSCRTLTPVQEAVAVALRRALPVSLDDLLALAIGLEPMAPRWRGLRDLERACPIRIRTILTDRAFGSPWIRATMARGKAFTDRLFGLRRRAATGAYAFDRLCAHPGIGHRLTPPASPRTSGMVERFNGRIEAVLQGHQVRSGKVPETTQHRSVRLCNRQLPQSALGSTSPLQAMKDWHKLKPQQFRKQPCHLPGCDTQGCTFRQVYYADLSVWQPRMRLRIFDRFACGVLHTPPKRASIRSRI